MKLFQETKGITLVALVITIIVLLILAGVSIVIANDFIVDKAVNASARTFEATIKEQMQLAWEECQIKYWEEKNNTPNITLEDYMKTELPGKLANIDGIGVENVSINLQDNSQIGFTNKNESYIFRIAKSGETNLGKLLKGNVKVGDYVEYPVEYKDVFSKEVYTSKTGWRVIDDGLMNGTSGVVKLISSHIPAKWYYEWGISSSDVISELNNNFGNVSLRLIENNTVTGNYFIKDIANKVTILSLDEFNYAYNAVYGTNRASTDITPIQDANKLFNISSGGDCWLSTSASDSMLYYVTADISDETTNIITQGNDFRFGIKPVIWLDENAIGTYEDGVWKNIN